MPKNNHKGKKKRVVKTRRLEDIAKDFDPATFEVYGQVTKILGNRRFEIVVQQLKKPSETYGTIICSIKGSYRRRIVQDNYVLVKLYDFNINQGQIIDSYSEDEIASLKACNKWDFPLNSNDDGSASFATPILQNDHLSDTESEPEIIENNNAESDDDIDNI